MGAMTGAVAAGVWPAAGSAGQPLEARAPTLAAGSEQCTCGCLGVYGNLQKLNSAILSTALGHRTERMMAQDVGRRLSQRDGGGRGCSLRDKGLPTRALTEYSIPKESYLKSLRN